MVYSVVMLDDKERQNLSLEEVKELFFKRQINQNSLIYSRENPQWQMLKRAFDVAAWIPSNPPPVSPNNSQNTFQTQPNNPPNAFQPQQNPFEQHSSATPPVTFNQFSPQQTNPPTNNYAQNSSNGYSQNNQTETYYQAETNQSQYNFQNNQANFAPSNYNNQPNTSNNQSNNYKYSSNNNIFGDRNGLRPAAIFLIVNAIFNVVLTLMNYSLVSSAPAQSSSYNSGRFTGFFVSLIIDILLAVKLWKNDDVENARKWVLIRTYLGFIVFGIIVPFVSYGTDGKFAGAINFFAYFLLFVSILLVLHGKQNPSTSRVMVGIGTFAMFFLFNFGIIALSSIVMIAPNLSKLELTDKQLDKYRVEGKEFQDKTNGAKVVLPEGWSMLSLDNPLIHTPEARMIAIDKTGNSLTMLEVVPVPGNLDMKQANSTYVLDKLTEGVVAHLKEGDKDDFSGKGSFREITRINIYIGKHPAKLLVFEKTAGGIPAKGHLIITFDELTFYILHSWCPVKDYDKKQEDFTFFEKNFSVPDKINSPFTQSAEIEKNKTSPKKNF
ncbi:MAG: hypothetical protein ABJA66_18285 [Actinomycetota bacterium]